MRIGSAMGFAVWGTVLGLMGYFFYTMHDAQQEKRRLRESLARLMSQERVARFLVKRVDTDLETGQKTTVLWWEESRPDGKKPVKEIVIRGDDIYFDTLQINFDPEFVKEGDPLRGESLTLLRRIYALEKTSDGKRTWNEVALDVPERIIKALEKKTGRVTGETSVPEYFRGVGEGRDDLEKRLWSQIWELSTDPQAAEAEAVRTAQSKSVGKPLIEGKEYTIKLSRTGQLDILGPSEPDSMINFKGGN